MPIDPVNLVRPVCAVVAITCYLDYLIDSKSFKNKKSLSFAIIFAAVSLIFIAKTGIELIQVYFFLLLFSIGLIILALKKQADAFTGFGIVLMVILLIILLESPIESL